MRSEAELLALADRALGFAAGDEAQATAVWERTRAGTQMVRVELVVLRDGRAGGAVAFDEDDSSLHAAAESAGRAAATGAERPPLPDPAPGRAHDGWDPAIALGRPLPDGVQAAAARTAVVSTRGVRAFEQRTYAVRGASAATRTGGLAAPLEAAGGPEADTVELPTGEPPVVLGPEAVAHVMLRAGELFSGGGQPPRLGERVAAAAVNLAESPRFATTLPRTYDAEGMPRRPVPLIQDGVAHRVVHDSTTGPTTGHARSAAGKAPPRPGHLVLVGGGAASLDALAAEIGHGLFVEALGARTATVRRIARGRIGVARTRVPALVDPLAVLAATQALTAAQNTIGLDLSSARDAAAAVAPGLRAAAGVAVARARS